MVQRERTTIAYRDRVAAKMATHEQLRPVPSHWRICAQQWNRQPNQMEPLMLIDASPPSMAAPVVRRQQGSVLHNRDLCRIISAFIPHQFPYRDIVEK